MNKSKLLLSTVLSYGFLIHGGYAADLDTNTARLQAMDKITGRVSEIDVPVNGLANFGSFSILVRRCVTKSPEETPENTAFVDVVDNYKSNDPVNIFKGWMFSSTPALNAIEHPIYDIWLLKCHNSRINRETLLTKEQLALRDTIPMTRPEKADIKTKIEVLETPENDTVSESSQEINLPEDMQPAAKEILNVDLETPEAAPNETEPSAVEEEFASEGEEPDNAETVEVIEITNETLAQEASAGSSDTPPQP